MNLDSGFHRSLPPRDPSAYMPKGRESGHAKNGKGGYALRDTPVADRARAMPALAERRTGLGAPNIFTPSFMRRTARDAVPPSSVVTAALLGDPRPGRSAQDKFERDALAAKIST